MEEKGYNTIGGDNFTTSGYSRLKTIYIYYFLIGIVSFVSLAFLPLVGSEIDLGWNLPNTTAGWIVWATVRLIISIINVLLFYCFRKQAKINVNENEKYKQAKAILEKVTRRAHMPRSPERYNGEQWGSKGITIFLTSALSTVALTQAALTYDWLSMLTYLFTIIMGLIFGIIQMKNDEGYWTDEYYEYAIMVQRQQYMKENIEICQ